jgi:hypothetical protein
VFLPKYSRDLNPIEQVFAKFKTAPDAWSGMRHPIGASELDH